MLIQRCLPLVALAGCFHVSLQKPPPHASFDERLATYERLRPVSQVQDVTVTTGTYAAVTVSSKLVLADGTAVTHAEDLLPVLDPKTPAGHAAARSRSARHSANNWYTGGLLVMAAGLVYLLTQSSVEEGPGAADVIAMGAMTVGPLVGLFGGLYYREVEENERRAAFHTYDASLRSSLALCVDGVRIVDCAGTELRGAGDATAGVRERQSLQP
jgi:hypothetical protein